jgi:hypothetical protein
MIISHKYRYVFVEAPHTGSTAISRELCELYDGQSILYKHANYSEFKRYANGAEKNYFIFSSVRNPLDERVSAYVKFLNNHKSNYNNKCKLARNGGWISDRDIVRYKFIQNKDNNFSDFLKKFHTYPYTHHINNNKKYCNFVIRFEHLQEDFSKVLKMIGITQIRPLPVLNKTKGKKNYLDYYDDNVIDHAVKIFSPFMEEWSYSFPDSWPDINHNFLNHFKYYLIKKIIFHNSKYKNYGLLFNVINKFDLLGVKFFHRI